MPNNNDFYVDNSTGDYYLFTGGVWVLQGNLRGPPGPPGGDSAPVNLTCDPAVSVKDWVRMDGTSVAIRAQADVRANGLVIGIVEAKPAPNIATVRTAGLCSLTFIGLNPLKEYILSATVSGAMNPRGLPTPAAPGNVIVPVGRPISTSTFLVRVGTLVVRS